MRKTQIYPPKPRLAPTEHPTMLDIAWAAGIFEGEGTTSYFAGTSKVHVCQKDPWILYRLQALFGGSICLTKPKQPLYSWSLYGARARGFLYTIFSFQSARRKTQIKKALAPRKNIHPNVDHQVEVS